MMATSVKQGKSTDAPESRTDGRKPARKTSSTFGRHPALFVGLFCLLCSAGLAAGTLVPRRYELSGTVHVTAPPIAELPTLSHVAENAVKELQGKSVQATLTGDAAGKTVKFSASGDNRNAQWVAVEMASEHFSQSLHDRAQDLVSTYRSDLRKSAERLATDETALSGELETFRAAHRGLLPDDPSSVLAQFDKLSGKLEDRQERLQVVTGQIARLQQLQNGSDATPVTPPPGATTTTQEARTPVNRDAEVVTLRAQLQLINDQIDEQLGTLRRTEQHPYVINLREKHAALQKKLEAAKTRAAAGEPPPPDAQAALSHGNGAANDQAVNMQIVSLQGERDALVAEVKALSGQQAAMQKRVDDVTPIRKQYEKLTAQLTATRLESENVRKKTEQLSQQVKTGDTGAESVVAVSSVEMASESTLPAFPLVPQVYGAALLLAGLVTAVTVWVMHRADRSWHDRVEATAALDVPVLGMVSEIRSRGERTRQALWCWLARPALVTFWLLLLGLSAWWTYQRLADPQFPQRVQDQGVTAFFCAGHSGD